MLLVDQRSISHWNQVSWDSEMVLWIKIIILYMGIKFYLRKNCVTENQELLKIDSHGRFSNYNSIYNSTSACNNFNVSRQIIIFEQLGSFNNHWNRWTFGILIFKSGVTICNSSCYYILYWDYSEIESSDGKINSNTTHMYYQPIDWDENLEAEIFKGSEIMMPSNAVINPVVFNEIKGFFNTYAQTSTSTLIPRDIPKENDRFEVESRNFEGNRIYTPTTIANYSVIYNILKEFQRIISLTLRQKQMRREDLRESVGNEAELWKQLGIRTHFLTKHTKCVVLSKFYKDFQHTNSFRSPLMAVSRDSRTKSDIPLAHIWSLEGRTRLLIVAVISLALHDITEDLRSGDISSSMYRCKLTVRYHKSLDTLQSIYIYILMDLYHHFGKSFDISSKGYAQTAAEEIRDIKPFHFE